jgi:hypothetical protein
MYISMSICIYLYERWKGRREAERKEGRKKGREGGREGRRKEVWTNIHRAGDVALS